MKSFVFFVAIAATGGLYVLIRAMISPDVMILLLIVGIFATVTIVAIVAVKIAEGCLSSINKPLPPR